MEESDQIHLVAARQQAEVDGMFDRLRNGEIHESTQIKIANAVRFFGKNLENLPESNETMLKVSRLFLTLAAEQDVKWSNRDYSAVLQMIIRLLLKRRDEGVVRQTASLLVDFANSLPPTLLKNLVKHHQKVATAILHKFGQVKTHYTQMKLLLVLKTILPVLEDGGTLIIRSEKAFLAKKLSDKAVELFNQVDCNNFTLTSGAFLDFYNKEVIQKGFVQPVDGFLLKVGTKNCHRVSQISINFGLGNLSMSFFIEAKDFSAHFKTNKILFVEVEDCDINVRTAAYMNPEHIHLEVKPMRYQILDKDDSPVNHATFSSMEFVVINKDDIFMSKVNNYFESKCPMVANNFTDNESILSFRTVNTSIVADMNYCAQTQKTDVTVTTDSTKDVFTPNPIIIISDVRIAEATDVNVAEATKEPTEDVGQEEIQQKSAPLKNPEPLIKSELVNKRDTLKKREPPIKSVPLVKPEPESKRQTATITPTFSTTQHSTRPSNVRTAPKRRSSPQRSQVNYDEIPNDEEALPSFRSFMRNKRIVRNQRSQEDKTTSSQLVEGSNLINLDNAQDQNLTVKQTKQPNAKKQKTEAKKSNPNGQTGESSTEVARKKPASRAKISLRDPPKRRRISKPTTYETSSSEEDLDALVIQELENRESHNVKSSKTGKVASNQMPRASNERPIKRDPLADLQDNNAPRANARQSRKRPAAEPAPVELQPKRVYKEDFDKLLDDKKSPFEAQHLKPNANQSQEIEELDDFIPYTQAPKKSGIQKKPPTRKLETKQINAHNSFKPQAKPIIIETPKNAQEPRPVQNSKPLQNSSMLDKFLNDSVSRAASIAESFRELNRSPSFEAVAMNTHTICKRSPTDIHTVQIREVTYRQTRAAPADGVLRSIFEQKICEETDAALEDIRQLREDGKAKITPERAAVLEAIDEGRELLNKSQRLAGEHDKMFKRLHQLESQMEQNCDDIAENAKKFVRTFKISADASRQSLIKRKEHLDAIEQDLNEKETTTKIEIWHEYINEISRILETHRTL